jgi:hypothetical protein
MGNNFPLGRGFKLATYLELKIRESIEPGN